MLTPSFDLRWRIAAINIFEGFKGKRKVRVRRSRKIISNLLNQDENFKSTLKFDLFRG
jgi:hypothetical protein